jgi:hypothetical protein
VSGANWGQGDNLSVKQFDAILFRQDSCFNHPMIFRCREWSPSEQCRHTISPVAEKCADAKKEYHSLQT